MSGKTTSDATDAVELMSRSLRGASLDTLEQYTEDAWQFHFNQATLLITCPWRIVVSNEILLSGSDHGQKFGLPSPLDAISETLRILGGKVLERIEIDATTADLRLTFSGDSRIDVFNDSSGYEGWNYPDRSGVMIIAIGGGGLAIWDNLATHGAEQPRKN